MSKLFYDPLIHIHEVTEFLTKHQIDSEEQEELVQLIDEIYHHHVLKLILDHLPKEHHEEFIDKLSQSPADPSHIDYLKTKVTVDIEAEITGLSTKLRDDLLKEIRKSLKP